MLSLACNCASTFPCLPLPGHSGLGRGFLGLWPACGGRSAGAWPGSGNRPQQPLCTNLPCQLMGFPTTLSSHATTPLKKMGILGSFPGTRKPTSTVSPPTICCSIWCASAPNASVWAPAGGGGTRGSSTGKRLLLLLGTPQRRLLNRTCLRQSSSATDMIQAEVNK